MADYLDKLEHVRNMLSHYTYKPGYRFSAGWGATPEYITVALFAKVPDSRVPMPEITWSGVNLEMVTTVQSMPVHVGAVDKALPFIINALTEAMEMHERDEWLRHDGELVRDPHADVPEMGVSRSPL